MNRRNFVLGLGTVATVSGAVSVTAASITDTVEADASFEFEVDRELTVRRNNAVDPETDEDYEESSGDLDSVDNEDLPRAFINDDTDNDLQFDLRVLAEELEEDDTFENSLEVENEGSTTESFGITYEFTDDVDGEAISQEEVVDIFYFEDSEGDRISPESDDTSEPETFVELGPGDEEDISLVIDVDSEDLDAIAEAADAEGDPFSGAEGSVELIDGLNLGVQGDDE